MLLRLKQFLFRPTDALPLDIFRILVGFLIFAYFLHTLFQVSDFSDPDGLIDHELSRKIFWFTRMGLFHPGLDAFFFKAIFLFACLCSWALILGYRVKLFAAVLYLIAVSTYRWNFLVMFVDDSIMHLSLFWMLMLPVGRTLTLKEWRTDRKAAWERWKHQQVPGFAVRCFLWNLALIYLVAGAWKWTSPMWRDGTALYVILKLPISLQPDFWGVQHLPLLKLATYGALVFEPLFPLIFILRRGHPAKYLLLVPLLIFHVGTVATLRIPYANIACCAALIIPFGGELMQRLRRRSPQLNPQPTSMRLGFSGAASAAVVTLLTLAMLSSVMLPHWRTPTRVALINQSPVTLASADSFSAPHLDKRIKTTEEGLGPIQWTFFAALWCAGVAQQYQLFNWIDDRNYFIRYEVVETNNGIAKPPVDDGRMFPRSTRGVLLQFYSHGVTWMRIPPEHQTELRRSLQVRMARRYCRRFQPDGEVAVYSTLERISPAGNRVEQDRVLFMKFACDGDAPRMQVMNLNP